MRRKNIVLLILVFSLLLGLCGCGENGKQENGQTLWVVTEQSCSDGMNLQAKIIAQRMEEKYDNLTIQLDILPSDAKEREVLLKQLRTRIMAGKGPDVFLLPVTDCLTTDYIPSSSIGRKIIHSQIEPLFWDVTQIMRGGLFADVQAYYMNDTALEKQALKTEVMDAGVLDGKRYVLPLRFDIPVILTTPEDGARTGLSSNPEDAAALVRDALSQEDAAVLTGLRLPDDLSLLPRHFDYKAGQTLLTAEQIAEYLRVYQAWKSVNVGAAHALLEVWEEKDFAQLVSFADPFFPAEEVRRRNPFDYNFENFNRINWYIGLDDMNWHTAGLPLFTCRLSDTLETLPVAKHAGFDVDMYPLRATDGSVVASITYFGAVGCCCENPELAYEFLREFLTEEFQWDLYRPRGGKNRGPGKIEVDPQTPGQVEDSWPVRTVGSVPYLWDTLRYQYTGTHSSFRDESPQISREIHQIELTDDDLPALNWPIDEVRFPVFLKKEESIEYALSLLNKEDGTPTDADIDALAEQVYQNLRYHLAEG